MKMMLFITSAVLLVHLCLQSADSLASVSLRQSVWPARPGMNVTLQCLVRDSMFPVQRYYWSYCPRTLQNEPGSCESWSTDTSYHTLTHIGLQHAGYYTCFPETDGGNSSRASTTLDVYYAPILVERSAPTMTIDNSTESVFVNITTRAFPYRDVRVLWTTPSGIDVTALPVIFPHISEELLYSSLTITNLQAGTLVYEVYNSEGSARFDFYINEINQDDSEKEIPLVLVLIVAVNGMLGIILICVILGFCCKQRRQQMKLKENSKLKNQHEAKHEHTPDATSPPASSTDNSSSQPLGYITPRTSSASQEKQKAIEKQEIYLRERHNEEESTNVAVDVHAVSTDEQFDNSGAAGDLGFPLQATHV